MEKRDAKPRRLRAGTERIPARSSRRSSLALAAASLGALAASHAQAQQTGLNVSAGSASLTTGPAGAIIRQTTEKAVLNWQSFGVAAGTTLQFIQPDTSAIALNRVYGGTASSINGSLLANGQVWIINPAGVLFGRGATVNVGGLVASTIDISDQNFINGNYAFGTPSSNAAARVDNQGAIAIAPGGSAVLAGAQVTNEGVIQATLGKVVLAGADGFAVDFQGDKLLSFAITKPVSVTPLDASGKPAAAMVGNSGTISAAGGQVLLEARAARGIINSVLNTSGMIEATTASEENGEIVLDAGPGGTATVSGKLDVSGAAPGQTGGKVAVTGGTVALAAGAAIDASGDAGGGTVAIGGDLHGAGKLANAKNTSVAQGVTINASATGKGNGGTVSVWSDNSTVFDGAITVRGGARGGNGGYAETSGAVNLSVTTGQVDALAPQGQVGTWLLDPASILVGTSGTATLDQVAMEGGPAATINGPLTIGGASANVVLRATGDITFAASVIMVNQGVSLEADAGGSILVQPGVSIQTAGGAINFTANTGSSPSGAGSIALSGVTLSTARNNVAGGAVTLTLAGNSTGSISTAQTISTETGAITFNGNTILPSNAVFDTDATLSGNSSTVAFNGQLSGSGTLNIQHGTTVLNGTINLGAIAVQAVTLAGSVTTSAGQSYGGPVTLSGDTTLADSGSGIAFNAAVTGAGKALTVTTGATSFGSTVNVGALSVQAASLGGNVTTSAGQSYGGAVTLPNSITLSDSGSGIIFHGAVTNSATKLTISQSAATFLGAVTLASLSTQAVTLGSTVTTSAGQTYNGPVTLAGNTTLSDSGSGGILFKNAVTGAGDTLTVTQGATTFDGAIAVAGVSLQAATLAGSVTTTAGQTYNGAVTLTGNTTLSDSGSGIVFASTVSGAGDALAVTHGATTFDGAVTLGSLSTQQATLANAVTTTGGQSYGGPVTLTGNTTLSDSGSGIVFASTVLGAGDALTVTHGATTFDGVVTVGALAVQAATLDGNVTTTNGQTYNGAVMLGGNVTLSDSDGGIAFDGMVSGAGKTLAVVQGATTFGGTVGVGTLSVQVATLDGDVSTTSGQTYNGAVTLGSSVTLSDAGSGIVFGGTLTGAGKTLTVAQGTTTLGGAANLGALSVGAATLAGNVTTTAGQTYNGAVTLGNNVSLADSGGGILFKGSVAGASNTLTVIQGATIFDGTVTVGALSVQAATLDNTVTTSAGQSYNGAVTLGASVALTDSGSSTIAFHSTMDGAHALTVNDTDGTAIFGGAVGAASPLTSLKTSGVGTTVFDAPVIAGSVETGAVTLAGGAVTTTGGQNYGAATLVTGTTLTDTGTLGINFVDALAANAGGPNLTVLDAAGTVRFGQITNLGAIDSSGALNTVLAGSISARSITTGAVTLDAPSITTSGNQTYGVATIGTNTILTGTTQNATIAFTGTLQGDGSAPNLTVGTAGAANFGGAVSGLGALNTISTTTTTFGGSVTTSDGQTYGAAALAADVTLSDSGAGGIDFTGALAGGGHDLTVVTPAGAAFGVVANIGSFSSTGANLTQFNGQVTATNVATGAVVFNGGSITTSGGQRYGATTAAVDTTLTDSGTQGIVFNGALSPSSDFVKLTVNDAAGSVTFGAISGLVSIDSTAARQTVFTAPVSAAAIETGVVLLNGGSVTTLVGQDYGPATIGANTTLTDIAQGADISFHGTVQGNGTNPALTVVVPNDGTALFSGAVSGIGAFNTAQTAQTTLNAAVTAASVATGTVTLGGGSVITSGGQNYGNATLTNNITLTDTGTQGITFAGSLGTNGNLFGVTVLDASGTASFGTITGLGIIDTSGALDTVLGGPVSALSITTGAVALNGGSVTTTDTQTYGAATVGVDTTLTANSGGTITFTGTLQGNGTNPDLTIVDTSGTAQFEGTVSNLGHLNTVQAASTIINAPVISVDATTGIVYINGNVTTTTGQHYGNAELSTNVTLSDVGPSGIDFTGSLGGNNHDLTVLTTATAIFGNVSGVGAFNSTGAALTQFNGTVAATSVATGTVVLGGGSVMTSGGQHYGTTTLAANATLTDTGTQGIAFTGELVANSGSLGLTVLDAAGTASFAAISGLGAFDSSGALDTVFNGSVSAVSIKTGAATLDSTVTTTAGQTYNGAVTLDALDANVSLADSGGGILFEGSISGAGEKLIVTQGAATFDGAVSTAALATQAATLAGNVTTSAGQSYNGAVTVATDLTLADTGAAPISFHSTVDGAHALTVSDAGGTATFIGAVGGSGPLASLNTVGVGTTIFDAPVIAGSVTTGAVTLAGGSVITSGGQSYGTTTLASDTTLTDTGTQGITFTGALTTNPGTPNLTVLDAAGSASFAAITGLGALDSSGALRTVLGGPVSATSIKTGAATLFGNVTTTAGQNYNGAATLGADVTLADTGATGITFTGALNGGGADLTAATPATLTFSGAITNLGALTSTSAAHSVFDGTVNAASLATGAVTFNTGNVTTTAGQTYNGAVTLGTDVTLADSGTSGIVFYNTVDGAHALTLTGNSTFGGVVGGNTPLTSLSASGAVTLAADTTLDTGALTINGTIDGPGALTIQSPGSILVTGDIGDTTPLAGLVARGQAEASEDPALAPAQIVTLEGSVTTTGLQTYTATTVNLQGTASLVTYQTNGAPFTVNGTTVLGGGSGSNQTFVIDTIGDNTPSSGDNGVVFNTTGDISASTTPVTLVVTAPSFTHGTLSNVTLNFGSAAPPSKPIVSPNINSFNTSNIESVNILAAGLTKSTDSNSTESSGQAQNSLSPGAGSAPGPIESMSGPGGGASGGAASEGEELASSVALSLGGKPGVARNGQWAQACSTTAATGGTLCEVRGDLHPRATPQAVQPVDTPYSSWGNESLWQQ